MTHPLTPREKVAQAVRAASRGQWTDGVRVGSAKWCNGLTDAILTDLASGSGDHAELARSAEEALLPIPEKRRKSWFNRQNRFRDAANPATVLALLAEIAALRGGVQSLEIRRDFYKHNMQRAETRATEAERKLAEAVGLLAPLVEAADCLEDRARDTDHIWEQPAAMCINAGQLRAICTFLSKEAERDKL